VSSDIQTENNNILAARVVHVDISQGSAETRLNITLLQSALVKEFQNCQYMTAYSFWTTLYILTCTDDGQPAKSRHRV